MGSVFISYRREDTEGQARALFQDLVAKLGRDSVFMDVDSIGLGRDFRTVLQERLATCDVMLVLIGPDWLAGKDKLGRRRLDNPGDYVRLEVAAALKRNIPVTPLLLHGAAMPAAEQLPEDLSDLAFRNGFEISHNRWDSDVQELIKRLGLVARNDTKIKKTADAQTATRPTSNKLWPVIAGAVALAIAVVIAGFWYYKKTVQEKLKAELEVRPSAANVTKSQGIAPKPSEPRVKNLPDSSPVEKKPAISGSADKRASQEQTHYFDSPDFRLRISNEGHYLSSPFAVEDLDPSKDFELIFQIKSTRNGGSTRYGIAWNYTPEDFLLFTLHSTNGGYYSIGPGRSRTYAPFSRLSEGYVSINAEGGFDNLQMAKNGSALLFAINGREIWRTTSYKLTSNQFAFWVADFSEATLKSYSLRQ